MSLLQVSTAAPRYPVPAPSAHPVWVASGLLLLAFGATRWLNDASAGPLFVAAGALWTLAALASWFIATARDSERGIFGAQVDRSFRWSMSGFIFSEVMFFAAFFGALYWTRLHALPALGDADNQLLWPGFAGDWPGSVAGATGSPTATVEPFRTMGPWPIPTINTALLLASGVTLTFAHHALVAGRRAATLRYMVLTLLLGFSFVGLQAWEYQHAYAELQLRMSSGIYGSTFYLLTGFHGFHVIVGALVLLAITVRLARGHFTPQRHFGFEAAAWYWHFVDVVWLGLYVVVYWL